MTQPITPEPNLAITGDEARLMIAALAQCNTSVPAMATISLYTRLLGISQVQPPQTQS